MAYKDGFLFGVCTADVFDGDQLIAVTKTLITSGIKIGVSSEDVRAGKGAMLIGKPTHSGTFDLDLSDALFDMNYIAMNTGGDIEIGGDAVVEETLTVAAINKVTTNNVPVAFGTYGVIGWYKLQGDKLYTKSTFTSSDLTITGATVGQVYDVKYVKADTAMRQIVVPANILPKTVRVVLHGDIYAGEEVATSDIIGEIQIDVPRLKLTGTQDLAMSMTGACNVSMAGSALASNGNYATIKDIRVNTNWFDSLISLAIADGEVEVGETLQVWGVFANAKSKIISPSLLDFVGASTVGVVTGSIGDYVTSKVKGTGLSDRITAITGQAEIIA